MMTINGTEYNISKMLKTLQELEATAYSWNIDGKVIGMDCVDFEQLMVDCADVIQCLIMFPKANKEDKR